VIVNISININKTNTPHPSILQNRAMFEIFVRGQIDIYIIYLKHGIYITMSTMHERKG